MKTDIQLQKDVMDELTWEPRVTSTQIGVAVKNGVVTLSGSVASFAEKSAAEQAARRVTGVTALAEEIQVTPLGVHERNDTEIATAAAHALKSNVWVPSDIQAIVEKGVVTLRGHTTWEYERQAAEVAVRFLSGVISIVNAIVVKPRVKPVEVQNAIETALKRNAEVDAKKVKVAVDGGTVTLSGRVRSWMEREEAEKAAWNAPGVTSVRNEVGLSL